MRFIIAPVIVFMLCCTGTVSADMFGNPAVQIGKKNLSVGLEYTYALQTLDFDTRTIDITSQRANLKLTTGLTRWFDIFAKVGGASLMQDYENNYYAYQNLGYAISNYDSKMNIGFGGGGRLNLYTNVDSGLRFFVEGGGYYLRTEGTIVWQTNALTTFTKDRETRWADVYAGAGLAKRMDFVDLHLGFGVSQVEWWITDMDVKATGNTVNRFAQPERSSWELGNPLFGFVGIDFVLPLEYRFSVQAGVRTLDNAEFSIAISQGLEPR